MRAGGASPKRMTRLLATGVLIVFYGFGLAMAATFSPAQARGRGGGHGFARGFRGGGRGFARGFRGRGFARGRGFRRRRGRGSGWGWWGPGFYGSNCWWSPRRGRWVCPYY